MTDQQVEVDRLTAVLHSLQKHPDYEYRMTFDGHRAGNGWVENPEMSEGFNGVPDSEKFRRNEPRQHYWMKRKDL